MNDNQSFQRFAAITAIVSFFTAMASNVLQGIPVHFNSEFPIDPLMFLSVGSEAGNLLRWGLILDLFGYYLPLLPLVLLVQHWFKEENLIWIRFFTICGLGYILIGAIGAVTLAVVQPPLIRAYAQASPEERLVLETIFGAIWNIVYGGLWNILGELFIGIWFFGAGLFLRHERRAIGIVSMIVGISAFIDSLGNILELEGLAFAGLSIFLILAPIWALWFGIDLLRKPVRIPALQAA